MAKATHPEGCPVSLLACLGQVSFPERPHKALSTYLLTGQGPPEDLRAPGSAAQKGGQETSGVPGQKTLGSKKKVPKLPYLYF